ncbi:Crossover junction endodeoxyribonuclease RuvC [Candidatus Syntrophocurvum alkaliphilum]|uniref:Crossover junction endodeoxyribonuclease RuvC n=1 Tax=Candidatus Syntrophocurvum alkaliphilum TaxID=2293317 RepID=A0A6I6DFJ8_9FIRM|nr:crossover junction endodeoxyribonuclease RuvC [Candidatus Syntrophocurvum alkaliphilum]QGT99916.1 Crossover junction endodeoxyribonuclease RuvC [Candidatus Syntrophocurvum alkaliphilum]
MITIGIDPGTATTGYGVIDYKSGRESLIDYGVISTPSNTDMSLRLLTISNQLNLLINKYRPEAIAIEQIFYHKNAKTVITVAQARGVAMVTSAKNGLDVFEYTPLQVKQAVVGYGSADKRQVQVMVQKILNMSKIPRPDDAADALAVAICHVHSKKMLNISRGGR